LPVANDGNFPAFKKSRGGESDEPSNGFAAAAFACRRSSRLAENDLCFVKKITQPLA
jgi:hypothetical protein